MIQKDANLPLYKQMSLLNVAKSSFYYVPKEKPEKRYALLQAIDRIYTKYPFYGSRRIKYELKQQGFDVSRKTVTQCMRFMGISAIYPKPRTSIPQKENKIYPYLLRDYTIDAVNDVWCADITYIPLPKGFVYVVAVMDWHSRAVLSWRLSTCMDTDFCVAALEEALVKYGKPHIFNTDQGSQFTSQKFTNVLKKHDIQISMDGRGRFMDNIFIERLWRSLKYEEVYLHAYESPLAAKQGIGAWFEFYNTLRPHMALSSVQPLVYYEAKLAKAS